MSENKDLDNGCFVLVIALGLLCGVITSFGVMYEMWNEVEKLKVRVNDLERRGQMP